MDAYPPEYTFHNLPFIVLSGLDTTDELDPPASVQDVLPGRATTTINSELPPVTGKRAQQLRNGFLAADGSNAPWHGRSQNGRESFRIRTVGREFKLPPKKADAPSQSSTSPPTSPGIMPSWILHSPISPLSPGSTIFPDGLLAPAWIAKHQHFVPSVFISFFTFGSDPTKNTLNDNLLKSEIAKIKAQILKSEYRTRYAVVLLSDTSLIDAVDTDERLANIKRATGLDPKNSLFFLPQKASQVEIRAFVANILATLHPVCIEYYRDLTKHARRKKGRGAVPSPTAAPRGTSHPLTQQGWNVRYDFKMGVFAEFRQEMDVALRHYQAALESLFGSDGILETTASWSPRWDEIRLLADTIALRQIRCELWGLTPTSAVRSWLRYKDKLRDLLDRRGKGSSNYGWEAWESRWAQIMAQLIQRADLPVFKISKPISADDPLVDGVNAVFSLPEKQVPLGGLPPWELLHHAGYWYKISADHAKRRFILARDIPEEDRIPPGMSPATKVSARNQTYDNYLVPEPHLEIPVQGTAGGFEHWRDIVTKLDEAVVEFEARGQMRKVEQLQLEISRTLLYAKRYEDTFKILRTLWETMSWRRDGWWDIASEVLWALHECALRVQDLETYVLTEWELYSPVFAAKHRYRHDLMKCLDRFPQEEISNSKPSISINTRDFQSSLSITLTFAQGEGNVGEPLRTQIALTSTARPGSAPITLSTLMFQFKGCLSEIQISHNAEAPISKSEVPFSEVEMEESSAAQLKPRWRGSANLVISPGQTRVYDFPIIFREAGDVNAVASIYEINTDRFDLVCTSDLDLETEIKAQLTWWLYSGSKLKPRKLNREAGPTVKVLPKPPKMEIRLPDFRDQYYTDEPVTLAIEVQNQEDEETEAVLEVRLLGRSKDTLGFEWVGREASSPMKEVPPPVDDSSDVDLPGHVVGRLAQGAKITERIHFTAPAEPADYVLEVKVLYHVLSDRDIPISKTIFSDIIFNSPFNAKFEFTPRFHPDPWPSFFQVPESESDDSHETTAQGITQRWGLEVKVESFAEDTLIIKDMAIETHAIHGGTVCTITKECPPTDTTVSLQNEIKRTFNMDTRKLSLEERRATGLDMSLLITWQRSSSTLSNINLPVTTSIPIPRVTLPSSEPRVLATAVHSPTVPNLIHMDYVLENPTMHFLTFELSMEASEDFGFAGPKNGTVKLLPLSRQIVRFNIMPCVERGWVYPELKVVDRWFNQVLKVVATEGLRGGKKGVGVWVGSGNGEGL